MVCRDAKKKSESVQHESGTSGRHVVICMPPDMPLQQRLLSRVPT
jgi:hypothetical protein